MPGGQAAGAREIRHKTASEDGSGSREAAAEEEEEERRKSWLPGVSPVAF